MGLLLLAACARGTPKAQPPGATLGTAAPTTTTTNPYAVPPVIDAAYVNRVLAGLDAATGDIIRAVVSSKAIMPEVIERLKAIYSNKDLLQLRIDIFQDDLRRGLQGYKLNPGNNITTVEQVLRVDTSCLYAKVSRDASALANAPDPRFRSQWVAVRPSGTTPYNPTGWSYVYEGAERDLTEPKVSPCSTG